MKKHRIILVVNLCIISIVLISCTPTVSPIDEETVSVTVTATSAVDSTPIETEITTEQIQATASAAQTPIETATAPIISGESSSVMQHSCSSPVTIFNLRDSLDIQLLTELRFIDETKILVEGWSTSTNFDALLEQPNAKSSADVPLRKGTLNIVDGTITALAAEEPAFPAPTICPGTCYVEMLENSPDEQWQIILVRIGSDEERGIWLVSEDEKAQLVSFAPVWVRWDWSEDGSMLWFEYALPEFGIGNGIVQLESPPKLFSPDRSKENPLASTWYHVAFSPQDKTVMSVPNLRRQEMVEEVDNLYLYDFEHSLVDTVSTRTVPDLVKVEWNDATQGYLQVIAEHETIQLREATEESSVRLSLDAFAGIMSAEILQHNIPFSRHALSTTRGHLAISMGDGRVFVFDCTNNRQ